MTSDPLWGLPDPDTAHGFYDGVPAKRLVAWLVDAILCAVIATLAIPFTAFTALFFFPILWFFVSFVYRTATIANGGATWGMRFVGIELRDREGSRPDTMTAALHSGGYLTMTLVFPAQLISILLMLTTSRGQGLHDMVLGTAMINRPQ